MPPSLSSRLTYGTLFLGLLILTLTNLQQRELHFDDERWYLENVEILQEHGLSSQFLLEYRGSAGPLFAVIHWILSPVTQMSPPGLHLVNLVFLLLSIWVLASLFRALKAPENGWESLFLLAVPMTYVCTGMVLTEMPAFFFLCLSLWALHRYSTSQAWLWLIISALSFSAAILGRQVYLILLPLYWIPMLPSWPLPERNWLKAVPTAGIFSLLAFLVPAVVFYHWQGLTSIFDAKIYAQYAERGISYAPIHVVFALGYLAMSTLLIAPRFFMILGNQRWVRWSWVVGLGLIGGNVAGGWFSYLALEGILRKLVPASALPLMGRFIAGGLLVLAAGFVIAALLHAWKDRSDRWLVLATLACLGIALTSIKITHQFSSRYVAQVLPFLFLILIRFPEKSYWGLIGKLIGAALGLAALYTYF
ncbi:MAG: glycosyltransferase family 39 protein [Bacteroidota bacterium]